MPKTENPAWWIYQGTNEQNKEAIDKLPEPPPWRRFDDESRSKRGTQFKPSPERKEIELVNAALYLRRPLLVTGKPGTGKTTLAYAVAHELGLEMLRWSITTRSTLQEGLYRYDAIARLQDAALMKDKTNPPDIGNYLSLGPLGTAFAARKHPCVLLIDEIDKSDIDLPNDLLHIFEEGEFEIPELARLPETQQKVSVRSQNGKQFEIERGKVCCDAFPLVVMTSNGEKEFPPPFLRRCLQMDMVQPDEKRLGEIVKAHFERDDITEEMEKLIELFVKQRSDGDLANDQLLNAIYLVLRNANSLNRQELLDVLWKSLSRKGE
ncbi:MAG: MoxR family ATPase [Thiotrichaceae bacterium]